MTLHLENAPIVDSFQFPPAPGGTQVPATLSVDVTWTATGQSQQHAPSSLDPSDPGAFAGQFQTADATASFTAASGGASFSGTATSAWAEMGHERNGFFIGADVASACDGEPGPGGAASQTPAAVRVAVAPSAAGAAVTLDVAEATRVTAEIYDVLGRRVATLLEDEPLAAGQRSVQWGRRTDDGRRARSGIYFVRWRAPGATGAARFVIAN